MGQSFAGPFSERSIEAILKSLGVQRKRTDAKEKKKKLFLIGTGKVSLLEILGLRKSL